MGREKFTTYDFDSTLRSKGISYSSDDSGHRHVHTRVTAEAEQHVRKTGRPRPSVDPAVMTIRRSLPRFDELPDGRFVMTVGCPVNVESSCDTTGSMGSNVQTAIEVLPETYGMISEVLPGYDPQLALGIFGDVQDNFPLNRPQFEMTAEKIVNYVTDLAPESDGGDAAEDPQYAAFGAAYLTDAFLNRLGLMGYHFIITDAPMHHRVDPNELERIYGENVWKDLADNGFGDITRRSVPDVKEVFKALHKRCHAFYIAVGRMRNDWFEFYDPHHRVLIDDTRCLPAIEAAIIGLTEGTLQPMDVRKFLEDHQVSRDNIEAALPHLMKIKFAEQRKLQEKAGIKIPQKGDVFAKKTDLQPVDHIDDDGASAPATDTETSTWL